MSEQNTTIESNYFARRDITLGDGEIVVVACLRNEALRLPYFLTYYRQLGVSRFLLVDNNSTDGGGEYLQAQPDVEYFHTTASFRGSAAGRLWNHELAETYAMGHWVLTPDLDELFVYPGSERFDLHTLCRYLDAGGYEGVYAPMIDMYSDRPLSQTHYEAGSDFLDTCSFFETDSYDLQPIADPPFLGVYGGPRGRMFQGSGKDIRSLYTKVPLVKWRPGHSYIRVTHTHRALQLADVTAALLHFKFFSTWGDVVVGEAARGDRRQVEKWSLFADYADKEDPCLYGPQSRRYTGPKGLVGLGVMAAPEPLKEYYRANLEAAAEDPGLVDELLATAQPGRNGFDLQAIAALWPFVQNPGIARHYGRDERRDVDYRRHLVRELASQIEVVDVHADHVLVRMQDRALHRWRRSGLALAAYVGGRLAGWTMADGSAPGLEFDTTSLEANVCRWNVDISGAAAPTATDGRVSISVYLGDAGDPSGPEVSAPDDTWPRPEDALIFSRKWHIAPTHASWEAGVSGVVTAFQDGELAGCAYDVDEQTFDLPVNVYVNDRLVAYVRPRKPWPAAVQRLGCPPGVVGRGFRIPLPLGYFEEAGEVEANIIVRPSGTNIMLNNTPITLPIDVRTALFQPDTGWVPVPPRRAVEARNAGA